jgi:hypothetical protein
MERTVLEKFCRRNGPAGPSIEVIADDDYFCVVVCLLLFLPFEIQYYFCKAVLSFRCDLLARISL